MRVRTHFKNFYNQINEMIVLVYNKDFKNEKSPLYLKQFSTFYDTWKMNTFIGGGIKILDIIVMLGLTKLKTLN